MTFQLIIFDLDGVLVDSEPIVCRVWFEMLVELGFQVTYEDIFAKFTGLSNQSCINLIESKFGKVLPADFKTVCGKRSTEALKAQLKPIVGVVSSIEAIKQPMCIASGSGHERIKLSLEVTGLLPKFVDKIFSASDVTHGKPAPDLFLYAAEKMGYLPKDCAVIEDSLPGVQAGVAAGMTVFAYTSSLKADALAEAGAHYIFEDMHALPNLLKIRSTQLSLEAR